MNIVIIMLTITIIITVVGLNNQLWYYVFSVNVTPLSYAAKSLYSHPSICLNSRPVQSIRSFVRSFIRPSIHLSSKPFINSVCFWPKRYLFAVNKYTCCE